MTVKGILINDMQKKIAAGVITAVIIGLGATSISFVAGKASKDELKSHCEENKRVENAMYWQIGEQRSANNEKWKKQESVNEKVDDKLDKIIEMLNEISGDNKAIKVEIKYLSERKKSLSLINDSMFDEKY